MVIMRLIRLQRVETSKHVPASNIICGSSHIFRSLLSSRSSNSRPLSDTGLHAFCIHDLYMFSFQSPDLCHLSLFFEFTSNIRFYGLSLFRQFQDTTVKHRYMQKGRVKILVPYSIVSTPILNTLFKNICLSSLLAVDNEQGICPICSKEEDWSHTQTSEGIYTWTRDVEIMIQKWGQ
jgi:hypothetical protein